MINVYHLMIFEWARYVFPQMLQAVYKIFSMSIKRNTDTSQHTSNKICWWICLPYWNIFHLPTTPKRFKTIHLGWGILNIIIILYNCNVSGTIMASSKTDNELTMNSMYYEKYILFRYKLSHLCSINICIYS